MSLKNEDKSPEEQVYFNQQVAEELKYSQNLTLAIKRQNVIDKVFERQCDTCHSVQPPYVFHCLQCKRCVVYCDHHCPWINNCVGYYSQKPFLLFTVYAMVTMAYSAALLTKLYNSVVF